jgi:alanine racemase
MHSPVTATLSVNLDALAANYRLLQKQHHTHHCAAVVKANAYGLGVEPVAKRLVKEGCETFFVATLTEAIELRRILPAAVIYVFHGAYKGEEPLYLAHNLRPVLNSLEQMERWKQVAVSSPQAKAALHVDTGMCRLGLTTHEMKSITNGQEIIENCNISLLMSHLACASTPSHPLNREQLALFSRAKAVFAGVPTSLSNSSGLFLDSDYHEDMGRPGCALYGITPRGVEDNPMQHVATLIAPIIQVRHISRDQTIGYGGTTRVTAGMKIAVISCGYADGLHRIASHHLSGFIGEHSVPLLGRVSMDMTCYDVSAIPDATLRQEASITLISARQTVDKVAQICHTIGYEIFTSLSSRVSRVYHGH